MSKMCNFVNRSPYLRVHMHGEFLHVFCLVSHIIQDTQGRCTTQTSRLSQNRSRDPGSPIGCDPQRDVQGLLGLSPSLTSRERNVLRSIPSMEVWVEEDCCQGNVSLVPGSLEYWCQMFIRAVWEIGCWTPRELRYVTFCSPLGYGHKAWCIALDRHRRSYSIWTLFRTW